MKTNLAKSISSGYLLFFVSNVVALFLTPFILSYITSGEYGLYVIALDIIAWISLVQFGSGSVLGPKIASYYSNYELNLTKINRIVSTAFYMQIFYAIAGFVLFIIFGYYIINDEKVNFTDINSFIFIVAFSAFFTILNQVFSSMIIATKKIYIDNLISIFFLAIRVILIAALIRGMGLMAIAWALFISNLLILIRSYFRIKTLFPNIKISTKLFNKVDLNFLFGNGLYFAIGGLAMLLITKFDNTFIGKKIGMEMVTSFYITGKLYLLTTTLINSFINNYRPYISSSYGEKDFDYINNFLKNTFIISLMTSTFFAILLFILNDFFIKYWVGDQYNIGKSVSILFAVNMIIQTIVLPYRLILASTLYKIKWHTFFKVIEGISKIILTVLFLKFFQIEGVLIATIVSTLLFSIIPFKIIVSSLFTKNNYFEKKYNFFYWILIFFPMIPYYVSYNYNFTITIYTSIILEFLIISIIVNFFKSNNINLNFLNVKIFN